MKKLYPFILIRLSFSLTAILLSSLLFGKILNGSNSLSGIRTPYESDLDSIKCENSLPDSLKRFVSFDHADGSLNYYSIKLSRFLSYSERGYFYELARKSEIYMVDKGAIEKDSAMFMTGNTSKTRTLQHLFDLYEETINTRQYNLFNGSGTSQSLPFIPPTCAGAHVSCTGNVYTFPAGTTGDAPPPVLGYPNYGCLSSRPAPAYYYMQVSVPGDIIIQISDDHDVDFICWGPFSSLTDGCSFGLTGTCNISGQPSCCDNISCPPNFYPRGNITDCSYSGNATETCHILNAQVGQIYILLITNYTRQPGTITFQQTSGTGVTDCNIIVHCSMIDITATPSVCDGATNTFSISGSVEFTNAPPSGTMTIIDNTAVPPVSQTFFSPFTSPQAYNLTGIPCDGTVHSLTAAFSDSTSCTLTQQCTSPPTNCPQAHISGGGPICNNGTNTIPVDIDLLGYGPFTFTYALDGVNQPPINNYNGASPYVFYASLPGTYTMISVSNSVCLGPGIISGSAIVSLVPLPTPTIAGNSNICEGASNIVYTTESGMTNYIWTVSSGGTIISGGTATDNSVTLTWNTAGTQSVSINYTNVNGCSALVPVVHNVTVNSPTPPTITGTSAICPGTTGVVYTSQAGMTNYSWAISAGGTITGGGTATDNTATVTWNTAGAQTISLNYTDANGCTALTPTVYPINVNPLPTATINGANTVCQNAPSPLITFIGASSTSPYTFTYNINGGANQIVTSVGNSVTVAAPTNVVGPFNYNLISVQDGSATTCSQAQAGSVLVTVNPLPTATITGNTAVCQNDPTPLITFTGASSTAPYTFTYNINGGANQIVTSVGNSVTVAAPTNVAGIFTYNLLSVQDASSTTCSQAQPGSAMITVNPLPTATISGTAVVCQNAPSPLITFTGAFATAPYTFTYNINGGGNQVITTVVGNSVTIAAPTNGVGPFSYNLVSVQDASSTTCSQLQAGSAVVTVNPLPTATISGTISVCKNEPSPLITFTGASATAPYTFTYNINGGGNQFVTTAVGNSVTVSAPTNVTGVFTYNLVSVQDGSGTACSQPQVGSAVVTVNLLPTAIISGTTTVCQNTPAPLITFTGAATTPPYTFTYNINGGGNQVVTTVVGSSVTIAAPTNVVGTFAYNLVSVQDGSATTCSQAQAGSAVVTVNPLPTATISGNTAVCQNAPFPLVTFTGASATAPYTFTYNINGGANQIVTSVGNSVTVAAPTNVVGPFTYNLVSVKDASSTTCSQPQAGSALITINPLPTATIAGSTQVCQNAPSPLITFTGASSTAPYTFTYNINGGANQIVTSVGNSVTIAAPTNVVGPFTYNLISVQDGSATTCSQAQAGSALVTVNPLPTATISGSASVCQNAPSTLVTFTGASSTAPYTFTYNINGGANQLVTSVGNSVTVSAPTIIPGTYVYNLISVKDASATTCSQNQAGSTTIIINPLPVPTITGPLSVCANSIATYSTEAAMTNYNWTISGGGVITAGGGTNNITVHWGLAIGTYSIQVNYINSNGCTAAAPTAASIVVNTLPVPNFLAGLTNLCSGLSSTYTTDNGMSNYSWTVSAGGSITAGGGPADNTVTILWNTAGSQTVTVNYVMGTGCTAPAPIPDNITVKPRPSLTNVSNSTLCSPGKTNIMPTADLAGSTFSWTATGSSGNVTGFNAGAGVIIADSLKNTGFNIEHVNYVVTPSLNGCDGTPQTYIVTLNPIADVTFTPNGQTLCSGLTTSIALGSGVAGTNFTWTATGSSGNISGFGPGAGNTISQILTSTGLNNETATYHVSATANGCPGETRNVVATVAPIPSVVFTPCTDVITTTDAVPFTLKGGIPLGGTYSGTGVNAGIFYPSLAGAGTITINYSYTSSNSCSNNASITISVVNAPGFTCDNPFQDLRNSTTYPTVKLGTQCWMAKNLDFGIQIPGAAVQRDNCVVEKSCYQDNAVNCTNQGGLYQWDKLMQFNTTEGIQGLCPPAWHIPTEAEWSTLFNFYTSNGFAGSPLKSSGFSGFNALLAGPWFDDEISTFDGFATFFWSSTMHGATKAWAHAMNNPDPSVSNYPGNRSNAFHVRCIKN